MKTNGKVMNKHARVGVKRPLAADQRRAERWKGYRKGVEDAFETVSREIERSTSLKALKKEWGL